MLASHSFLWALKFWERTNHLCWSFTSRRVNLSSPKKLITITLVYDNSKPILTSFRKSRKQWGPSQLSLDLLQFWPSLESAWQCTSTRKMMMTMLEDSSGLGITTKIDWSLDSSAVQQNELFCSAFPSPFRHLTWEENYCCKLKADYLFQKINIMNL